MSNDMLQTLTTFIETASPCEILQFVNRIRTERPELGTLLAKAVCQKQAQA